MPAESPRSSDGGLGHGLPTKISGVVFWALLLLGIPIAYFVLDGQERTLLDERQFQAARAAVQVERLLDAGHVQTDAVLEGLSALMREHRFAGLTLRAGGIEVGQGVNKGDVETLRIALAAHPGAELRAYFPPLRAALAEARRNWLLLVGGYFLVFGLVLQRLLSRLLSRPIQQMVRAADACTRGDAKARFDETRSDEFGHLARFINRALDYVMLQRDELREALSRVRASETALASEKDRALVTLHSIGDGVVTTDAEGRIEHLNAVAERLTGHEARDARGRLIREVVRLLDERERVCITDPVAVCLRDGVAVDRIEHLILTRCDGAELDVSVCVTPIRDRGGVLQGSVMVFNDVSQSRSLTRQLSYQAAHDLLTGLPNRREFERQMQRMLDEDCGDGRRHVLCYIDLDQFKVVNDTSGHSAGDELLRQVAALLQAQVRESDVLARLGGDEFGIIFRSCTLERAMCIAEELLTRVRDYRFLWEGYRFEIGASIGIVAISAQNRNMADVLSAADIACYAAKEAGRNRLHVYEPDDSELKRRHGELHWVSRLRRAMDEDRLVLYGQRIVATRPDAPPLLHFEILVRLLDEEGRIAPPMAFIPAAERYQLMPALDRWVLRAAMKALAPLATSGIEWMCALNLSGQSLGDDRFLAVVNELLDGAGIPGERLCFEITETAAIANLRSAVRFLNQIKARGCRFALDDFGSGLSSFAYLKNLPVDYLKIDGSFVKDLASDPIDRAMVAAIHQIGKVMGIQTIGECVEDDEILGILGGIGVDYAQGYGIERPRPLAELLGATGDEALRRSRSA
jgi:diguanylate cyclase (GGDEF)-like protein/PAS domain S-box-containing protein